eukprot:6200619-Pleurochrysis_carterae.AAC.2
MARKTRATAAQRSVPWPTRAHLERAKGVPRLAVHLRLDATLEPHRPALQVATDTTLKGHAMPVALVCTMATTKRVMLEGGTERGCCEPPCWSLARDQHPHDKLQAVTDHALTSALSTLGASSSMHEEAPAPQREDECTNEQMRLRRL